VGATLLYGVDPRCISAASRCARPLPHGFTGHVAHPSRSIETRSLPTLTHVLPPISTCRFAHLCRPRPRGSVHSLLPSQLCLLCRSSQSLRSHNGHRSVRDCKTHDCLAREVQGAMHAEKNSAKPSRSVSLLLAAWRSSCDWCRLSDVDANSEPSHWDARAAPAIRPR